MKKHHLFLGLALGLSAFVSCKKEFQTAAAENTVRASPAGATATALSNPKNGPLGVCYVEVNNHNILNTGAYTLKNGGQQLFDMAIVFAANINYDVATGRAVLYSNNNVTKVLANRDTYIKPLQDKGIKVTLSILGNHQGPGVCNFTSRAAARDFARQLALTVSTYGLDGIDFDDEYANYGNNGTGQPNDSSFTILTEELRTLMPDKIISFYYFGPARTRQTYGSKRVGDFVNYSWNAVYGTYSVPNVPPLAKSQLGPAAVWINNTLQPAATTFGARTVAEGYGIYLWYDLHGQNEANYLSGPAFTMYGDSAKLSSPIQPWTQGNAADAPNNLNTTGIGTSSATLNWAGVSAASSYSIDYKPALSQTWTPLADGVNGTSFTLTGLDAATAYDWRIKSNDDKGGSTYAFAYFSTAPVQGVIFFDQANYGGTATTAIPKGTYTLAQLASFGFTDNWASSAQIPDGWVVTMYSNDKFKKTSWTLTAGTRDFSLLTPSADNVVSSVTID